MNKFRKSARRMSRLRNLFHFFGGELVDATGDEYAVQPQQNPDVIARLKREIVRLMAENDVTHEQCQRLDVEKPGATSG